MIDLEVPVDGVARDALDAFLSSDRSPPDSAALIFDSGPRVIAKTPLDDPQTASPPTVASSAQNRSWRTRPCATPGQRGSTPELVFVADCALPSRPVRFVGWWISRPLRACGACSRRWCDRPEPSCRWRDRTNRAG